MDELKPNAGQILKVTILAGPCTGTTYLRPTDKEIVIGRHSQCALPLPQDIKVSRFHCRLYEKNGRYVLEDLKSSNGTFFQEQMLTQPVEIKPGDRFQLGETYVEVSLHVPETSMKIPADTDSNLGYEMKLPSLEPIEENTEESPGLKIGSMETVVGVSLSDIWSEMAKYSKGNSPVASGISPTIRIPVGAALNQIVSNTPTTLDTPKMSHQDLMCIQAVIPNFTKREALKLTDNKIVGRYILEQKIGEARSWVMLKCKDREDTVYIQYTKEYFSIVSIPGCHPQLLLPIGQGEFSGKHYRVFSKVGEPISLESKTLPELEILQIAVSLCDVMLSLHEVNIYNFDLHRSSIFYRENGLPYFTIFPAKVYDNLDAENADMYSLGLLLWELATGETLPLTPIGTLDNDRFLELSNTISDDLFLILGNIFKRLESSLMGILGQFQFLLQKRLSPKIATREPLHLHIAWKHERIIFSVEDTTVATIPCDYLDSYTIHSKFLENATPDTLKEFGTKIYQKLYPSKVCDYISLGNRDHLVLHLDDDLLDIAWEFAYNGKEYLTKKYSISRKSFTPQPNLAIPPHAPPRVTILAQHKIEYEQIQNELISYFQNNYPQVKIKAYSTQDDPFDIVQNISQTDIFHVIVQGQYLPENPLQSGWFLEGKRWLKLRFLENAPRLPKLIFCHGPVTGSIYQFLRILFDLGAPHVVGCLSHQPDMEFIKMFYQYLLQGLSPEIAIRQCRIAWQEQPNIFLPWLCYGHSKQSIIYASNE